MPRSSHPAAAVGNVILLSVGLATTVAGVAGLFSFREMWWAFALFAAVGPFIFGAALHGMVRWGRSVREDEVAARTLTAAAQPGAAASPAAPVLAHWTFGAEEWRRWAESEIRFRTREALGMAATVLVLGTLLVGVLEREWMLALAVSASLGAFIGVWRWSMAWVAYRRNRHAPAGSVVIGPESMLVNGRLETLSDGRICYGAARVLATQSPPVLEIAVKVPGRYRHTVEEYRIPIPAGRTDEAARVADALNRAHGVLPAASSPGVSLPRG